MPWARRPLAAAQALLLFCHCNVKCHCLLRVPVPLFFLLFLRPLRVLKVPRLCRPAGVDGKTNYENLLPPFATRGKLSTVVPPAGRIIPFRVGRSADRMASKKSERKHVHKKNNNNKQTNLNHRKRNSFASRWKQTGTGAAKEKPSETGGAIVITTGPKILPNIPPQKP